MNGFTSVNVTNYNALSFHWREQEQNTEQNYTIVAWNLMLSSSSYGQIITSQKKKCTIEVNGSTSNLTVDVAIGAEEEKTIASGTTKIYHNVDGTKAFSYSFMVDFSGITFGGVALGEKRGNGSGELTPLLKASVFALVDTKLYLGGGNSFRITPASNTFLHTIKYKWLVTGAEIEDYLAQKTTDIIVNFTLPLDLALTIPNARFGKVLFTCITYDENGKELGIITKEYEAYVNPALYSPYVFPRVKDINDISVGLTGDNQTLVDNVSNVYYEFNAEAQLGATIVNRFIKNGKNEITNLDDSGTINNVDGGTFIFIVEDSRGLRTTYVHKAKEVNYYYPTCEITNVYANTDNELHFTVQGTWYNGHFGASSNALYVSYRYKDVDTNEYSTWVGEWYLPNESEIVVDGYKYSKAVNITGVDYTKTYSIEASVMDGVITYINAESKLSKVTPVFDWSKEDFAINVPTTIQGGKAYGAHILFEGSSADVIYSFNSLFSDYDYIEIIYTDNNGRGCGSTKVFDIKEGDVRTIDLSLIEASSTTGTYIRRTSYYCNNYAIFPETSTAGYAWLNGNTVQHVTGTNYLRVIKIIGYK